MTYKELTAIILGIQTDTPENIAKSFHINDDMTCRKMMQLIKRVV